MLVVHGNEGVDEVASAVDVHVVVHDVDNGVFIAVDVHREVGESSIDSRRCGELVDVDFAHRAIVLVSRRHDYYGAGGRLDGLGNLAGERAFDFFAVKHEVVDGHRFVGAESYGKRATLVVAHVSHRGDDGARFAVERCGVECAVGRIAHVEVDTLDGFEHHVGRLEHLHFVFHVAVSHAQTHIGERRSHVARHRAALRVFLNHHRCLLGVGGFGAQQIDGGEA